MAGQRKRKGSIRVLIACLAATLAIPAAAAAMPQHDSGTPPLVNAQGFPLAPVHRSVPGSVPTLTAPPSAVRVVRTINVSHGDTTLSLILAALALGVALSGTAYVTVRLRPAR